MNVQKDETQEKGLKGDAMVTPLQPLIDATPALGHLDLVAGTVYGPGKIAKKITVNGNNARATSTGNVLDLAPGSDGTIVRDLIADGPTALNSACFLVRAPVTLERVTAQDALQYGIRQYRTNGVTVNGATIRRVGSAYEVNGFGDGTVLNDVNISQIDRIMVDTAAAWGGDGISLFKTDVNGTVRVNRITVSGCRAKTTLAPWPWDGSAFEGYGVTGKLIVDGFMVNDCVNFVEVGTDTGTPTLVPTGWELRNGTVNGNAVTAPGWDKNCEGLYLRANKNFIIENVTFNNVDDFVMVLVAGGTYGGAMGNNVFRYNTINIKAGGSGVGYGPNRAYIIGASLDPKAFGDVYGNKVVFDPATTPDVALFNGKPPTNKVSVWASQTGWSLTGETWGPNAPVDPCADVKAQLLVANATIAQQGGTISTLTTQNSALTQTNLGLTNQVNALTLQNAAITADRNTQKSKVDRITAICVE